MAACLSRVMQGLVHPDRRLWQNPLHALDMQEQQIELLPQPIYSHLSEEERQLAVAARVCWENRSTSQVHLLLQLGGTIEMSV